MGRPAKLSPQQRAEIERRLIAGEKAIDLAKEFGVHRSQISRRVAQQAEKAKTVANQIFAAEESFRSLPVAQQASALQALDALRTMTHHMSGGGAKASAIMHRLISIASTELEKIDETEPLSSIGHMKSVNTLMEMARNAAHIPLNLLAANKDAAKRAVEDPPEPAGSVRNMSLEDATRAYQELMSG